MTTAETDQLAADVRAATRRALRPRAWTPTADLLALGWDDLLAEDAALAVTVLGEESGRALAATRLPELALRAGLGLAADAPPETTAVLVAPGLRPFDADVAGLAWLDDPGRIRTWLVPVRRDGGVALAGIPAGAADTVRPVGGMDPDLGLYEVRPGGQPATERPCDWPAAVSALHLHLAAANIGLAEAMVDLAREHVATRTQFGVPIGSFQAVQHRLADAHVATEAARAVLPASGAVPCRAATSTAVLASAWAVEAAGAAATQVMGAIACTWEHPLHRYVRRGLAAGLWVDRDDAARHALTATETEEVL